MIFPSTLNHANKKSQNSTIYAVVRPILLVAQFFGQMPLYGLSATNSESLVFRWKSFKVFYCVLNCCGIAFVTMMPFYGMLKSGANLFIISDGIFYGSMLMISLSFLQVSTKWSGFLKKWSDIEDGLPNTETFHGFKKKTKWLSSTACFIATVQYTANFCVQLYSATECKTEQQNVLEYYLSVIRFHYVFSVIPYSWLLGIYLQIIDAIAFFIWLFTDVFIITISSALAAQLNDVSHRVTILTKNKYSPTATWKILREDFNKLCKLSKLLDELISLIVLVSFGHNMFAILMQLFNSLRIMKNNIVKANFFFSFGFLIIRVIFVTLYGASINDESKRPITVLNSVPSEMYNLEIRRFIQQISFDSVALTGKSFFRVTRSLIFSIAGAIVTYELVLIQFNENLLDESLENRTISSCQTNGPH